MAGRFDLAVKFIHDIQSELQDDISRCSHRPNTFAELIQHVGELSGALTHNKKDPDLVGVNEVYHEAVRVAVAALRLASEGDVSFPYNPVEVTANVD